VSALGAAESKENNKQQTKETEANMKTEPKVKKLILKKEMLQDLTARHADEIKGGSCGLRTWSSMGYTCRNSKTCAKCVTKKQGTC
jgi:hypothetical protein